MPRNDEADSFYALRDRLLRLQDQGFLGTERRALAALDALFAVDCGRGEPVLRQRADGANFDRGAGMVLRAFVLQNSQYFGHTFFLLFGLIDSVSVYYNARRFATVRHGSCDFS